MARDDLVNIVLAQREEGETLRRRVELLESMMMQPAAPVRAPPAVLHHAPPPAAVLIAPPAASPHVVVAAVHPSPGGVSISPESTYGMSPRGVSPPQVASFLPLFPPPTLPSASVVGAAGQRLLLYGPVIGKVTDTTAVVTIETDSDVALTCSAECDKHSTPSVRRSLHFRAKEPRTFTLTGMCPDTEYTLSVENAVYQYPPVHPTTARTLPLKNQLSKLRVAFVGNDPGLVTGNDVDPWQKLAVLSANGQVDTVVHIGDKTVPVRDDDGGVGGATPHANLYTQSRASGVQRDAKRQRFRDSSGRPHKGVILRSCSNLMPPSPSEAAMSDKGALVDAYMKPLSDGKIFVDYDLYGILQLPFAFNRPIRKEMKQQIMDTLEGARNMKGLIVTTRDSILRQPEKPQHRQAFEADAAWLIDLLFRWKQQDAGREVVLVSNGPCAVSSEIEDPLTGDMIRSISCGVITDMPGIFPPHYTRISRFDVAHASDAWLGERTFVTIELNLETPRCVMMSIEFHTAGVTGNEHVKYARWWALHQGDPAVAPHPLHAHGLQPTGVNPYQYPGKSYPVETTVERIQTTAPPMPDGVSRTIREMNYRERHPGYYGDSVAATAGSGATTRSSVGGTRIRSPRAPVVTKTVTMVDPDVQQHSAPTTVQTTEVYETVAPAAPVRTVVTQHHIERLNSSASSSQQPSGPAPTVSLDDTVSLHERDREFDSAHKHHTETVTTETRGF